MSDTHEFGIATTIGNLKTMTSFCIGYGSRFAPSNPLLTVKSQQALYTSAYGASGDVKNDLVSLQTEVNSRVELFAPIKQLSTQILSAFRASGADGAAIANAETINHKLQGTRVHPIHEEAPLPPVEGAAKAENNELTALEKHVSVSQQSYVEIADHLLSLIDTVSADPNYAPNEVELQVATLTATQEALVAANGSVDDAMTAIANSRIVRNNILYAEKTGLVDVALAVKEYVKSVFHADSPEYHQISGLHFTRREVK